MVACYTNECIPFTEKIIYASLAGYKEDNMLHHYLVL